LFIYIKDTTGKSSNHVLTTAQCDSCHNVNGWVPANMDHNLISGSCSTCHNGSTATGKTGNHIVTTAQCDSCHNTRSWTPANFDHGSITGTCSSCHNGSIATGKTSNHFVTTLDCSSCHTTSTWVSITAFRHSSANYPGDHVSSVTCQSCHTSNSQTIPWPYSAYMPDCAGCHANDYRSGAHKKYENPDTSYSVSELRDCSGSCHEYTDSSMTTIKETESGEHRTNRTSW
jgi:hypothetical protein